MQWLYFNLLTPPSDVIRKYYVSDEFRDSVSQMGLAFNDPGVSALRGSNGSLYSFDQSLFVDGPTFSYAFGLSQVRSVAYLSTAMHIAGQSSRVLFNCFVCCVALHLPR